MVSECQNANNKVNRWSLELATYNISFERISGAKNKAADCLSRLVKPITTSVNMLTASSTDGSAFHTRNCTQNMSSSTTSTPHPDTVPQISQQSTTTAPKPLTADHLEAYCKCRRQTYSVNASPRDYWMARPLTINLILLLMSKDSYTNMSWMLVKVPCFGHS